MSGFFDDVRTWFKSIDPLIRGLLVSFVVVYLVSLVSPGFVHQFGLVPRAVIEERKLWQPFTWFFVHGGLLHILFNFGLFWFFGGPALQRWGREEFVKYLVICGLGSAATVIALSPNSPTPVLGSSGAGYGLIVSFALIHPDATLFFFFIPVRASYLPVFLLCIELFLGLSFGSPHISHAAHAGGMITGYIYLKWWWQLKHKAKVLWSDVVETGPTAGRARKPARAPRRAAPKTADPGAEMAEVDRVLDKILVSGPDSLTEEERRVLERYSEKRRQS